MSKKLLKIIQSAFGKASSFEDATNSDSVNLNSVEANSVSDKKINNKSLKFRQIRLLIGVLILFLIALGIVINFVQEKVITSKAIIVPQDLKVEFADKALDGEKMWRNHHEEELKKKTEELNRRIIKSEESVEVTKAKLIADTKNEIATLMEQLKAARAEMNEAHLNLREMTIREEERTNAEPVHIPSVLEIQDFSDDTEFDTPKSARDYVPEGTYFTGYLLGGIVVSTALSTADENATPLTIILRGRGNLANENKTDISKCRIMGSSYGDLSSERAIIRLEKLICEDSGMYITSHIAGDVHGPDGFNGIKGTVISTGSKHIKNAMIGGLISGFANSAKGQDGMILGTGGLMSTKSKGFKDMAMDGFMSGASNAGDKIANYYLRQAEAMSPVLTIPGGVRVNAQITEGFFMGEIGTHRRIKDKRTKKTGNGRGTNSGQVKPINAGEIKKDGSDDGWK